MKKILLSLIALVACVSMNAQNVIWAEYWSNVTPAKDLPSTINSNYSETGTTFKVDGSINGGTKFYNENLAGGEAPELLVAKKVNDVNGSFTANIKLNGISGKLRLEYNANNKNLNVSTTTAGVEIGEAKASGKVYSCDVNVPVGTLTLDITFTNSTSSNIRLDNIVLTQGKKTEAAGLQFEKNSYTAVINEENVFPALSNPNNLTVTYSSSNEDVATISADGKITLIAEGKTTISAHSAATSEYDEGNASYELTVKPAVVVSDEVGLPYEEPFSLSIGSFSISNISLGDGLSYVWKHDASNHYMKASAYANKNIAAESWLVSPIINMIEATDATLEFSQCINKYFGNVSDEATVWIKEVDGEWTKLNITYPPLKDGSNWSAMTTQSVDITSFAGKKVRIGFKYVSSDSAAGTWEIKNVKVASAADGISNVTVNANDAAAYNLAGQRIDANNKGIVIKGGKKFINK